MSSSAFLRSGLRNNSIFDIFKEKAKTMMRKLIFFLLLVTSFALKSYAGSDSLSTPIYIGAQLKFIGGLGIVGDADISKKIYMHGSAGWAILALDVSGGPGYRIFDNILSVFIRAHYLEAANLLGGERATLFGLEPGVRIGFSKKIKFYIEAGIILGSNVAVPNVGVLLYLGKF